MTEPPRVEEQPDVAEAQRELIFQARKRAVVAFLGALLIGSIAVVNFRACTGDLPDSDNCRTNADCEGVLGAECLHAPTRTYCTHTCNRNEDCTTGFHCGSPPWENHTTRLVCLKEIAPPTK